MTYDAGVPDGYIDVRKEVAEFATAMEAKLRKNDHKTGWQQLPVEALRRLMMLEIEEYNVAREFFGADEAMNELVDIANFAMMLRDRLRIERQKTASISKGLDDAITDELTNPPKDIMR